MADQNEGPRTTQREAREALEKQVAELKRDVSAIKRTLAERAEEATEDASGWYDAATERASRATQALRTQARSISGAVTENPGTISSAMLLGGLIGFVIGLAVAQSDRRYSRWY